LPKASISRGTALVTGASGGIGLELARGLARRGYDVVLVARSAERLAEHAHNFEQQHGVRAVPIALDLATPDAPPKLLGALAERRLEIDVLVNNAGFGTFGLFRDTPLDVELQELQLNVITLTALSKLLLPPMLAKRSGRILNVASTAAFQPGPYMAVYYASKAYVLSFSEALAEEQRGTGVTVTCLCPGATATEFFGRAGATNSGLIAGKNLPSAASVAESGIRAMERGRALAIPGLANAALPVLMRLVPRGLVTRMVARVQAPRAAGRGKAPVSAP
jgi:short-subunit dehydrogenase